MSDVRVLILGTGGMANSHAEAYAAMPGVVLAAGVDTNPGRLAEFKARHRMEHGFTSLADAIAWGEFDAVSNVTPDAAHHVTTMALLAAGKHVLCEKPLATNADDAAEMAQAAEAAGVVNMVNLTYRNVPALIQAHAMVEAGEIGEVRHFEAAYLQSWLTQDAWGKWDEDQQWLWRLSTKHGSTGVLGDIGVHIVDFATFAAGRMGVDDVSCRLTTFDKAPGGRIGEYVLDANDSFAMHVGLENGAVGVIHASRFASGHINDLSLQLFGTKGGLRVEFRGGASTLTACLEPDLRSGTWRPVAAPAVPTNYERFIAAIRAGAQVRPDFARGAQLQRVLDRAIESDAAGGLKLDV
ncbi:probable trehalosemaltose utilization protein [Oceanicola granulosus HTCC2516]|uniref:Probable trehalosemaltose utilization protein n=1 Tax=Oceanicola granulosus (strain ATCC BAA-861 / DSM 15982 / KCTC 12143 / HTCC2516) TaxID=314256 RepID=Q2CJK5_OCEGH|nr:Gfo/Idh/MocA family oxidoreductase [Oceanicola granulosus]EAR53134.1 probable trehalosemaltose utilization protein [Oceanicola granulosus HTCC2516]